MSCGYIFIKGNVANCKSNETGQNEKCSYSRGTKIYLGELEDIIIISRLDYNIGRHYAAN